MSSDVRLQHLIRAFEERFGGSDYPYYAYFAPGRVNIIGEHTDYNGGYVLPCALQYGTMLICRFNDQEKVRLASLNFPYQAEIPLIEIGKRHNQQWMNYPVGVMVQLKDPIGTFRGMDFLFEGDIPNGAGLSSSASIEMVMAYALNDIYNLEIPMLDLVRLCRKAENEFVGVNCGIMDQFAVGHGKRDHAIFLDCDTLTSELVPFKLKDHCLVISNTNKKRSLSDSKYNERVNECSQAVHYLSRFLPVSTLSQVSLSDFDIHESNIPDLTIRKRARHVISENQRVLQAVRAMREGDLHRLGELMNQSHESLRYDYEVTGHELDALVEEARNIPGVPGSRMTGAGFGGCTVSIVHRESVNEFEKKVHQRYYLRTGLTPTFYVGEIGDGVRQIIQ